MKIQLEKTVTSEIEVAVPSYWTDQENIWIKIYNAKKCIAVEFFLNIESYGIYQRYIPFDIDKYVECTAEEFEAAFTHVVENIKTML
jgi:hypothetical protein